MTIICTVNLYHVGDGKNALRMEPIDIILSAIIHSFKMSFKERPLPAISRKGKCSESLSAKTNPSDAVGCFASRSQLCMSCDEEIIEVVCQFNDVRLYSSTYRFMRPSNRPKSPSTAKDEKILAGRCHLEMLFKYSCLRTYLEKVTVSFKSKN